MTILDHQARKSYAMHRMSLAIDRGVRTHSPGEKDIAMRWASAWGLVAGIPSPKVRLRRSPMLKHE